MNGTFTWQRLVAVAAIVLLASVGAVYAQGDKGGMYGTTVDSDGSPLPGVTVTVGGVGADKIQVTSADGRFRFPGMDIGNYQLRAELEGFSTVEFPSLIVSIGRNTTVEVTMSAAVEEVITVTSESPLLDERKLQAGTTVSQVELEKIPTARDPWSILTQTPGVSSDRINVGGNESGQQAVFRAPGTTDDENTFSVDGVEITDMAAIGSSPTYYDFDQFQEMQFATGGSDIGKTAAGTTVNLVTKRGTNEFRGSARYMLTDKKGYFGILDQGESDVSADLAEGQESISGNSINRIQDYGFEAGGPLYRDRVWAWGSWGHNNVANVAAGGTPDNTQLENTAIKLNAQIASNNSGTASFNNGDKVKEGRDASPSRPAPTTRNQRGPTGIYKVEDTHVFSSSFFLTGSWAKVDGGFQLISQGEVNNGCAKLSCPNSLETIWGDDGRWENSYFGGSSSRPSEELKIDGSYFFNTGQATAHELKFGARQRDVSSISPFGWPGRNIFHIAGPNFGLPAGPADFTIAQRGIFPETEVGYTSAWVQDTMTFGSWTINAGLRWDVSNGTNPAAVTPANPVFPEELPAVEFGGNDGGGIEYSTIQPRVGVTYALGEERKTLLRGSFSRFAEQMEISDIQRVNPLGLAFAYYYFEDQNDNNRYDEADVGFESFLFPSGYDPADPASAVSPNLNDPGLSPTIVDELILGAEHSFLPEFVMGATLTWRQVTDVQEQRRLVRGPSGVTRIEQHADYVDGRTFTADLPDGSTYTFTEKRLRDGVSPTGGWLLRNGDRERSYSGIGVNFTKRLANKWMARGYVNYTLDETWSVPDSYLDAAVGPNDVQSKSDCDGCVFAVQSGGSGSKGDVFLQGTWSWNLNGMYQIAPDRPWGFNVAANLFGREGYPLPYRFATGSNPDDGINRNLSVVNDTDDFRADDIMTIDLRLEKEFRSASNVGFTFSIDGFNLANENFVLQRERNLNGARPDYLDETLSPRIWRLGVRINWR